MTKNNIDNINNEVTVLIFFNEMTGTITSLLDTYLSLNCNTLFIYKWLEHLLTFKSYFPKGMTYVSYDNFIQNTYVFDKIITSCSFLKNLNLSNIQYNKIIFLDSNTITSSYYSNNNDFFKNLYNVKNKIMLSNEFNSKILDKYNIKSYRYYHKISNKRLDCLDITNFIQEEYNSLTKKYTYRGLVNYSPHCYCSFRYTRHIQMKNIIDSLLPDYVFYENIGKLIFEYLYFNKTVYYSCKNKTFISDGLTEYFKILGINDDKDIILNNIDISKLLFTGDEYDIYLS